ncbi:MAG: SAM-dependent methyltransferase [Candidatus Micrarchaeia archaeon]
MDECEDVILDYNASKACREEDKSIRYAALTDSRFILSAKREISKVFGVSEFEILKGNSEKLLIFDVLKNEIVERKINVKNLVFADYAVPIDFEATIKNRENIAKAIKWLIEKILDREGKPKFKIEIKKLDFKSEMKAKDLEVVLGKSVEEDGFVADMLKPDMIIFVVLGEKTVVWHMAAQDSWAKLDYYRFGKEKKISRAEFKIKEAMEFFDIDTANAKKALDIGSAPGGWANYLASKGMQVVAVDNALLDYGQLEKNGKILVISSKTDKQIKKIGGKNLAVADSLPAESPEHIDYRIIHLKENADLSTGSNKILKKLAPFDILTIDVNREPKETAELANSLAGLLATNATLVITIKLMKMSINRYMEEVAEEISKNYKSIIFKKLPHNKKELTVFAKTK